MARKIKTISIYEKIEEINSQITSTEQHLAQLKSQLEELLIEKDEYEMKEAWQEIKDRGMTLTDIRMLLDKNVVNS